MSGERLLSHIDVRNFKSVQDAQLELRPLTVVVGPNSAGKSSILQCLFLLAQITRSRTRPDIVSLNGMELNLGNFPELLHAAGNTQRIEIGIRAPANASWIRRRSLRGAPLTKRPSERDDTSPGQGAAWTLVLEDSPDELGVASVASIRIEDPAAGITLHVHPNDEREQVQEMFDRSQRFRAFRGPRLSRGPLVDESHPETAFAGGTTVVGQSANLLEESFPAIAVDNGLPIELYGLESESFLLAQQWVWLALRRSNVVADWPIRRPRPGEQRESLSEADQADATEVAERIFPEFRRWVDAIDRKAEPDTQRDVFAFDEPMARRVLVLGDAVSRELSRLLDAVREDRGALVPSSSVPLEVASGFSAAMNSVHYLGPLRAEPSPSYRPGQGGGVATLGMKGEFTVAVLHLNRLLRVDCPVDGEVARKPLGQAVDYWARRFGLASGIHTRDLGRPGVELELLDLQTDSPRDLTSVGVGVSQLLPVIVLCLLAKPGELVMLEQPELHLHPAPQQILGDFLLEIANSGRQLLVETHSEYLVNRLRLRVAEDEFGSAQDLVRIWYATRTQGETRFKAMDPDAFGSFEEWPRGFFDQTTIESEAILRAVASKRRASH